MKREVDQGEAQGSESGVPPESPRPAPEWINSVERAIEIAEGQLAAARALELKMVGIQADDLEKILKEIKSLRANYECREYLEGR